ncbi:hypothetical protein ACHAWF_012937 [Thalassiosira exigua]
MNSILILLLVLLGVVNGETGATNPFLSTTLSSKISPVPSDDSEFDDDRKAVFSDALTRFLAKIFHDQQVYDVKIISVNIFDDHVLKNGHVVKPQPRSFVKDEGAQHALKFSTVVAAEYTREDKLDSIAEDSFRKMLVHVCEKFQDHLVKFLVDTGDPYFMDVEEVTLAHFDRAPVGTAAAEQATTTDDHTVLGMSKETLNTASIVVILVGSVVAVGLLLASAKYYRKEKELRAKRLKLKAIMPLSTSESPSLKSPGRLPPATQLVDDYSFSPLSAGAIHGINSVHVNPYTDYKDDVMTSNRSMNDTVPSLYSINEEEVAFSSAWPESAPPSNTFPKVPSLATQQSASLSYTEQLNQLPRQNVFAPPGKIGVAIDVYNGQPVVHKIRKNSPLENMLKPNDVILAIDDEDASCLSAADVTSMMVKRMDRVRKITFVRRP